MSGYVYLIPPANREEGSARYSAIRSDDGELTFYDLRGPALVWFRDDPAYVTCHYLWDRECDGWIGLSDFSWFAEDYLSLWNLTDLALFSTMYQDTAIDTVMGVQR